MRKAFKLQDLDCANCAAKMENAIKNIEGVKSASISFMTQKLVLEADDDRFEAVLDEAQHACKKFEPDCVILRELRLRVSYPLIHNERKPMSS